MMMKMLEAGGMEPLTDNIRKADIDNPKGYYELERAKQIQEDTSWLEDAEGKVFKMVAMLLQHLPPEHRYHVVFMQRNMKEMLASQAKMLERLGQPGGALGDERMAEIFRKQIDNVKQWLEAQANVDVLYVDYSDVLQHPDQEAMRIRQFVQRDLDVDLMAEIVDPSLYRNKMAE
jgi:hypothetical protein